MTKNIRQAGVLLARSWRSLLFLEIIFKVCGSMLLFPLCGRLVQAAMVQTGVYYIASQNIGNLYRHPVLILTIVFVVLIFILYTGFELFCLAFCFYHVRFGARMTFLHMMGSSGRKTIGLLRPCNWLYLLALLIVMPLVNAYVIGARSDYAKILWNLIRKVFVHPVPRVILCVMALALVLLLFRELFLFQCYCVERRKGRDAFVSAARIHENQYMRTLCGLVLLVLIVTGAYYLFSVLAMGVIRLGVFVTVKQAVRQAVGATIYANVMKVWQFLFYSVCVYGAYAYVSACYFEYKSLRGEPVRIPRDRQGAWRYVPARAVRIVLNVLLVLVILVINIGSALNVTGTLMRNSTFTNNEVTIMAHRGDASNAPENTLPAIRKAAANQADYVEIDVRLTSDGVPVVTHDSTLLRTCGESRRVSETPLSQLRALDATGTMTDKTRSFFYGTRVPLLTEVMSYCSREGIGLNIEIKVNAGDNITEISDKVAKLIRFYGMESLCTVQSFNYGCLKRIKEEDEAIRCGYILSATLGNFYDLDAADFYSMDLTYLTQETSDNIHLHGKDLLIWTVDTRDDITSSVQIGADSVITNNPIFAREVIYTGDDPIFGIKE